MAFRVQGQKDAFDSIIAGVPANKTLEAIDEMIDWGAVRAILARGYDDSGKGWIGFDPIVPFKMLLLEQFYNLSDVQVSVEAGDRLSFRRFLALSAGETAPDDTTLVKFRKRMRRGGGLLEEAHAEFNRQLAAKNLFVKPGAIKVVDATVIRAATRPPKADKPAPGAERDNRPEEKPAPHEGQAQRRLDPDAAFGGKKGKLQFGYKLHAAVDAETGMIAGFSTTPANVSDTTVFEQILDGTESGVLADKGYDSAKNRAVLARNNAIDGIMRRVKAGGSKIASAVAAIETERNRGLSKLRSPSEGAFCALKRWRRLGRAVYTGLAKVCEQVSLAVLAHNLLKAILPGQRCVQ